MLGLTQMAQGQLDSAIACFDTALKIKPSYPQSHWNKSLVLITQGDYINGFREYEWRFAYDPTLKRNFYKPRWGGSPLHERTLFLYGEQGLGDTIQFVRFV